MPHYIEHWLQVFIDFAQTLGVIYACWRWHLHDREPAPPAEARKPKVIITTIDGHVIRTKLD